MDFSNEKYEYLLRTWGGFYNDEYKIIHGKEQGDFFFDSKKELEEYLEELRELESSLSAYSLATSIYEGAHVRYKTVAKMDFVLDGQTYPCEKDFGFAFDVDVARFIFEDGNSACDCTRADLIIEHGGLIREMSCGHTIKMINLRIEQIK